MSMNIDKCIERYKNDAEFHSMVEMFYRLIFENKISVPELKDALSFAAIKFSMENGIRNIYVKEE